MAEDRVALITGAGRGLNRATAMALADDGYAVSVLDLNLDAAEQTATEIRTRGAQALALQVDVADRTLVQQATEETVQRFGRIDVLVNGAGHTHFVDLLDLTEEILERMLAVHLKGAIFCTQAALPSMIKQGYGRIVCISSVGARNGVPAHSHYAAAKAGLIGFARALCREIGPYGVTINCVAPGAIETPAVTEIDPEDPARLAWARLADTPIGRPGQPEDVASAVRFLASEEAEFINGAVLLLTGGAYT